MTKPDGCTCRLIIAAAQYDVARALERIAELRDFAPPTFWNRIRLWLARRSLASAKARGERARLRLMAMVL